MLRLQKENAGQLTQIKNLNKAIDGFRDHMIKYETEKLGVEDKSEAQRRKEMLERQDHANELSKLNAKVRTVEVSKGKLTEEVTELKVKLSEKTDQLQALKKEKDEAYTKQQTSITQLNQERREKQKIQIELNRYQEEQKIGGNLGGGALSYSALEQRA